MYLETLARDTKKLLDKIKDQNWLKEFYLAGGTALALYLGHRQSIDLDWFTPKSFNTKILLKKLQKIGRFELINEEENTLEGYLDGVKLSFMTYPYGLLDKKEKLFGQVFLASKLDIALMKLSAIAGRNAKKDFIDLYYYLQIEQTNLSNLFQQTSKKFKGIDYDIIHVCKSLIYFKEAEEQPDPKMLIKITWPKVKAFWQAEVKKILQL